MYKRNIQGWVKHIDFILLDAIMLQISFIISYLIRHGMKNPYVTSAYRTLAGVLFIVDILVSVLFNTMHNVVRRGAYIEFVQSLKQTALVLVIMSLYMFSVQTGDTYSRITIYLTAGFHLILGFLTRLLWKKILRKFGQTRTKRTMILVADEPYVKKIVDKANEIDGFDYKGLVLTNRNAEGEQIAGLKVVANIQNAAEYICREWVDEVMIFTSVFLGSDDQTRDQLQRIKSQDEAESEENPINLLIDHCRQMAIPIHIRLPLSSFGGKSFIEKIGGYDVLTTTSNYASPLQLAIKRIMDIIGGIFGSIAALIVMLIVAPKIKKESPGPILFKQTRIGKNGKKFTFYKIRSMYMDAEERKKDLLEQNRIANGMMFKLDFDPRIIGNKIVDGKQVTGIGELIRSTSLDEFPQFFNVLMGQMSLVGTRPPTVDEWEKYKFHHRARLAFKPGITGLWQVSGRSKITDFEEVVKLDTEYIQHWSIGLDLKILVKTVKAVFQKDGAM